MDVFISYARVELALAEPIRQELEAMGLKVFFDLHGGIIAGDTFPDVIHNALQQCKALLALWTPTALASQWCRGECLVARDTNKLVATARAPLTSGILGPAFAPVSYADLTDFEDQPQHWGWSETLKALAEKLEQWAELNVEDPEAVPTMQRAAVLRQAALRARPPIPKAELPGAARSGPNTALSNDVRLQSAEKHWDAMEETIHLEDAIAFRDLHSEPIFATLLFRVNNVIRMLQREREEEEAARAAKEAAEQERKRRDAEKEIARLAAAAEQKRLEDERTAERLRIEELARRKREAAEAARQRELQRKEAEEAKRQADAKAAAEEKRTRPERAKKWAEEYQRLRSAYLQDRFQAANEEVRNRWAKLSAHPQFEAVCAAGNAKAGGLEQMSVVLACVTFIGAFLSFVAVAAAQQFDLIAYLFPATGPWSRRWAHLLVAAVLIGSVLSLICAIFGRTPKAPLSSASEVEDAKTLIAWCHAATARRDLLAKFIGKYPSAIVPDPEYVGYKGRNRWALSLLGDFVRGATRDANDVWLAHPTRDTLVGASSVAVTTLFLHWLLSWLFPLTLTVLFFLVNVAFAPGLLVSHMIANLKGPETFPIVATRVVISSATVLAIIAIVSAHQRRIENAPTYYFILGAMVWGGYCLLQWLTPLDPIDHLFAAIYVRGT